MDDLQLWLTPLIILPGVALMIMSTAVRHGQLRGQLAQTNSEQLRLRDRKFKQSLFYLYLSVVVFTLATLLTGVIKTLHLHRFAEGIPIISGVGVLCLIWATILLAQETWRSQQE